jgi:hypothetical protein
VPPRLDKPLKREIELRGELYTITLSREGVRIARKGARKGRELSWDDLLSGDAELQRDLKISLDAYRE